MPVDIDIAKVAHLARIALDAEELELYGRQLRDILEHAERVQALPTDGVEPTAHAVPIQNVFREDRSRPGVDRDAVLRNAPATVQDQFLVPKIVE